MAAEGHHSHVWNQVYNFFKITISIIFNSMHQSQIAIVLYFLSIIISSIQYGTFVLVLKHLLNATFSGY